MRSKKHGIRSLALAAMAALGVMAFGTGGAQAQAPELPGKSTAGSFSVNLATPSGQALVGEQLGAGYLLIQARDLKIECQKGIATSGAISNATSAQVTITFEGCIANNHKGEPLKGCQLKELETIKASALALPIVHGGERFLLFEPLVGSVYTILTFKSETVCALPLTSPVSGSAVAKVEGGLEGEAQTIVFSETIQLLSGDVLKYGAFVNTAYLNGIADIELEGGGKLGVH
jgi:hypothetical protein